MHHKVVKMITSPFISIKPKVQNLCIETEIITKE